MTEHPLIAILAIALVALICIRRNLIAHKRELQSVHRMNELINRNNTTLLMASLVRQTTTIYARALEMHVS